MARKTVDDRALPRIWKLAGMIGCSDREAMGTVVMLWGDSQDVYQVEGTRQEIIDWAHLYSLTEAEQEKWMSALQRCRIITPIEGGKFAINGNSKHVEALKEYEDGKRRGGEERAKSADRDSTGRFLKPEDQQTSSRTPAEPQQKSEIPPADVQQTPAQYNSIQYNSKEEEDVDVYAKSFTLDDPMDSPKGAIKELAGVCDDALKDVKQAAQRVWVTNFGLELVKRELPLAWAKWLSDDFRNATGNLQLYLFNWFRNEFEKGPKKATESRGSPQAASAQEFVDWRFKLPSGGYSTTFRNNRAYFDKQVQDFKRGFSRDEPELVVADPERTRQILRDEVERHR